MSASTSSRRSHTRTSSPSAISSSQPVFQSHPISLAAPRPGRARGRDARRRRRRAGLGRGLRAGVRQPRVLRRGARGLGDPRALRQSSRRAGGDRAADRRRRLLGAPTSPRRCTSATCARPIIGDALARVLEFLGHAVDPREPPRRLGHAVRHADRSTCATPGTTHLTRTSTALDRSTARRSSASTTTPTFADSARAPRRRAAGGDAETSRSGRTSSRSRGAHFDALYGRLDVTLTR